MGWQPNYQTEAHIYAKYLLQNKRDARIAVLYANDDFGKDYLKGLHDGLGRETVRVTDRAGVQIRVGSGSSDCT
jgi:branched-chain amino acid transport system substrate-binding protein